MQEVLMHLGWVQQCLCATQAALADKIQMLHKGTCSHTHILQQ